MTVGMAPVMLLSTVSVPAAAAAYELGLGEKISSCSSGVQFAHKSRSLLHRHDCSFSVDEKRIRSRFSSRALRARGGRLHCAGVSPVRAELAEDADKGNVIEVESAEEMARHLKESGDRMVVVNISTKTCGPCKLIYPKVVKMSSEYPDVLFLKINGDIDNGTRALMREWGVRAVPTFRFYSKGELVHSHSGAKEDELRSHFLAHYVNVVSAQ